jgi:hypothetical protein
VEVSDSIKIATGEPACGKIRVVDARIDDVVVHDAAMPAIIAASPARTGRLFRNLA